MNLESILSKRRNDQLDFCSHINGLSDSFVRNILIFNHSTSLFSSIRLSVAKYRKQFKGGCFAQYTKC